MSRPKFIGALLSSLLLSAQANAQPEPASPPRDPLGSKELAKAKWTLKQANQAELSRDRAEAAWTVLAGRLHEFMNGRGTLQFTLDAVEALRDAEVSLTDKEPERLAVLERAWRVLRLMDDVNRVRWEAGRINTKDWLDAQHARLGNESILAAAWAKRKTSATRVPLPLSSFRLAKTQGPDDRSAETDYVALLFSKRLAHERFEAVHADPKQLALAQVQPALISAWSRLANLVGGRGTLDFTLRAEDRLQQTRLAVAHRGPDRQAAFDSYWRTLKVIEDINEERYAAGRINLADWMQSRQARLGAELLLLQNLPKPGQKPGGPVSLPVIIEVVPGPIESKALARGLLAALHANPSVLQQEQFWAALAEFPGSGPFICGNERFDQGREAAFRAGRGTLNFTMDAARRLLDAELAVAGSYADRNAARQKYWARLWMIANENKHRYESGRINVQDYAGSVHALRNAEIEIVRARPKAEK